ncbi:Leucine aminopeptidase 1, partial [Rhizoclosmatium hyalinum]
MIRKVVCLALCSLLCQSAVLPLQKLLIPELDEQNAFGKTDLEAQGFRLIATSPTEATWMTEEEILGLRRKEIGFMDITAQDLESVEAFGLPIRFAPPAKVSYKDVVTKLFDEISIPRMQAFLTTFSGFRTRYYQSLSGEQSADWLYTQLTEITSKNPAVKTSVSKFLHGWGQFSIVVRVESTTPAKESFPTVIIGAHQDSANGANPYFGRAPGADDDGSGTTTVLEAYRVLAESNVVPKRPIEFHFY